MPLVQGQILNNRYRIVKLLGQGGFSAVYRAWDINMDRPLALKENLDTTPQAQRQFKREAQILFDLTYPNLPKVIDHFVIPGKGQYLVMEFIEGEDLEQMLNRVRGPLPEAQVLSWIIQVCDALIYLHSHIPPIIHRDIKPANIKITPQGKAFLVDFGIAKIFDPTLSKSGSVKAITPGYSPLEQYGQGTTDTQSDVYALGATLYHLLTGIQPPASVDIAAKAFPPPRVPNLITPTISPWVSSSIEKAMQQEKKDRWNSVDDFRSSFIPPTAPYQPPLSASSVEPQATVVISENKVVPLRPISPETSLPSRFMEPVDLLIPLRVTHRISWKWILRGLIGLIVLVALVLWVIPPVFRQMKDTRDLRSRPTPVASDFIDKLGVPMMLVEAGSFQMGSENGADAERPVHTVTLDAFYIDQFEVTNARYAQCVQAASCSRPVFTSSKNRSSYYSNLAYNDFPVIHVSWEQAQKYCDWRGARLPTEAEWEKAARGGLEGKIYPWGDDNPDCSRANFSDYLGDENLLTDHLNWLTSLQNSCVGDTSPVGSYPPNGYGLYDMAGNVVEWVMDWCSENYYASSPSTNPTGPSSGQVRGMRGGSWSNPGDYLRVTIRFFRNPTDPFYIGQGFRCARTP